jgi:sugar/nucleoside kinase (ribokinase family)
MRTLICGSLAFDSIMVFQDRFKHHILPDKIHMLNVSFLVPEMRREFGGCAGNIAYNLKLLGGEPLIMATVGDDFSAYAERLNAHAITRDYIRHISGTYTAQAFITTDLDDNQITAFHPGAMNYAHENDVRLVPDVKLGIVSPDGRDGMLRHVRGFHEAGVPSVFDPGQGMPLFTGEELLECVHKSSYVILNDYEAELLQSRTGESARNPGAPRAGTDRDARCRRLGDPRERQADRHSSGAPRRHRRPHRLRRRLPQRHPLRHHPRARLGNLGPARQSHGSDQDRRARWPESLPEPGSHRRRVSRPVWLSLPVIAGSPP